MRFHDLSTHNRVLVLRQIRREGALSRADLVRRTGFTAPSVSRIAEDLAARGLVVEEPGTVDSGPGRPPTLLRFAAQDWFVIPVQLFPDRIDLGLANLAGEMLAFRSIASGGLDARQAFLRVAMEAESLSDGLHRRERLIGIALTIPGLVDVAKSRLIFSPPTGWRDVALRPLMAEFTALPILVENWVNARALAEQYFGDAQDVEDFVYVHASSGIGASVTRNGRLYAGAGPASTEFGHLPLSAEGPRCRCGRFGCLEAYASLEAVCAAAGLPEASLGALLSGARDGAPQVLAALAAGASHLTLGLTGLIHLLAPQRVFLDGWPVALAPWTMQPLQEGIRSRVLSGFDHVQLCPSRLGALSPLIGAVALGLQQVLSLEADCPESREEVPL